jgi:hypothetical protein
MLEIAPAGANDIGRAIQLALAPVFLLTGVAGLLNVMTGRLARVIERGRTLAAERKSAAPAELAAIGSKLQDLERRRRFASAAITACTLSALLVCITIAALFLEVLLGLPMKWLAGVLFTLATLALVVGLAYFLREVHLATVSVRIPAIADSRDARD